MAAGTSINYEANDQRCTKIEIHGGDHVRIETKYISRKNVNDADKKLIVSPQLFFI